MGNKISFSTRTVFVALSLACAVRVHGQECQNVFLLKQKARIEITRYNGEHKPMGGKIVNYVDTTYTDETGNKVAILHSLNYTDKGEMNSDTRLMYICDGKKITLAYDNAAGAEKMYADMKAIAEKNGGKTFAYTSVNDEVEYPVLMQEGMEMKEYGSTSAMATKVDEKEWKQVGLPKFSGNYNSNGVLESTTATRTYVQQIIEKELAIGTEMLFTNIKVGAKEKVNVPAGSFECFKVTKEVYSKVYGSKKKSDGGSDKWHDVKFGKAVPMQVITEWYAPGIGPVRTEIKGPKGNVIILMEATKIES